MLDPLWLIFIGVSIQVVTRVSPVDTCQDWWRGSVSDSHAAHLARGSQGNFVWNYCQIFTNCFSTMDHRFEQAGPVCHRGEIYGIICVFGVLWGSGVLIYFTRVIQRDVLITLSSSSCRLSAATLAGTCLVLDAKSPAPVLMRDQRRSSFGPRVALMVAVMALASFPATFAMKAYFSDPHARAQKLSGKLCGLRPGIGDEDRSAKSDSHGSGPSGRNDTLRGGSHEVKFADAVARPESRPHAGDGAAEVAGAVMSNDTIDCAGINPNDTQKLRRCCRSGRKGCDQFSTATSTAKPSPSQLAR